MKDFATPDLCDAHEHIVRVALPGFRSFGGQDKFCGPLRTIKCHEDNSLVAAMVGEPGHGAVLVVDGGGSNRCALLGDNLARNAVTNNWAGIIVFGCVRDVEILRTLTLGVQALAVNPRRSVKRQSGLRDEPVEFHGVRFSPGEFVYADSNGIVVAAQDLLAEY